MSDAVVTNGEPSVALDPKTSTPAQAPVSAPSPEEKPSWLDARLERERRAMLKELGFENVEEAKKISSELSAKREAEKSDAQKRGELEATLKAEREAKAAMAEALEVYAKSQMSVLTEVQRNAVVAVAGDDPAKQLKTIEALRPTWASAAAPVAPVVPEKPKDTAPAPGAPKDAGASSSPPDLRAIYDEWKDRNPVWASRFALANGLFNNK